MKLLTAALALLVLAVANAHHTPEHELKYPEFVPQKTHVYELAINTSSGVPGLHPQVSKYAINMEVEIYAKTASELIIKAHRVLVSHSLPGVSSDSEQISMKKDSELENHMKVPFKAYYEGGEIKRYTLDPKESIESAKIKRTILRNLEIYLDETALTANRPWSPITYNRTQSTPLGNYSSHYVITSSPYTDFPEIKDVYNITRSDNYEVMPYLAYKSHHNYEHQGCPEVCKKDHIENPFAAGCPVGLEPYHTPMKKSFYQKHNIRKISSGHTVLDSVKTIETHIADVYDQNMEILLMTVLRFKKITSKTTSEQSGQHEYTDLNDMSIEINEKEISEKCGYPDPREAVQAVKGILDEIATTVISGNIEEPKSKLIGEHIILLQKALAVLKQGDLRTIQEIIVDYDDLPQASEKDKVKRQVWMDMLPVIGTSESVSYIVQLIMENMNKPNKAVSLWEATSILEALPMNVWEPTERTITELSRLLELITDSKTPGYNMFYSASHLAVARVINNMCAVNKRAHEEEEMEMSPVRSTIQREFLLRRQQKAEERYHRLCPKTIVKKFVSDVTEKLKATSDKTKRVIYIQTLSRTGISEVLNVMKKYVNGHIPLQSRSYIDYVRTVAIHSLYNLAAMHPRQVQDIVVPIFFNKTEPPKVRNAAFGVIIKSQPTLGLFQHIAEETWTEPSQEVASFVTSTLETFGNSTIPCHQLTARRIKKVLPQIKREVRGSQRAQNNMWSLFDSVRGFGLENRVEFTPSNESFIPSVVYTALGANIDSFRDIFFQFAVHSQGFTSRNVWDAFLDVLHLKPAEDIPKEKEAEIFPDVDIFNRDPEFWRFTVYEKLFYSSSYYYYDAEETNREEIFTIVKDQISHYLKWNKEGNMEGHIARVYIPSSYHTKAIAHAMPSPVEFEMRNPLLLSVKVKLHLGRSESGRMKYALDVKPSVYYTTLYTNQFLNLGDCKDIGVYHQKRVAITYPIQLSLYVQDEEKISIGYTFPQLPKTVFTYHSEAGTYAGKKKLVALPPMEDRRTIKTLPTTFKNTYNFGTIGLPPFISEIHTEDIQFGYEEVPRNKEEFVHMVVTKFLNAGWRRKSVVVKRVPDSATWTADTEVKMSLNFSRKHIIPKVESRVDWKQGLKFEDKLTENDAKAYTKESQIVVEKFEELPHIYDEVSVRVEQTVSGRSAVIGFLNGTYQRTYGGYLHLFHINASAEVPKMKRNVGMSASYAVAFANRPNEFNYKETGYGKQLGVAFGAISFPYYYPFQNPAIITKAVFDYKPLEHILRHETETPVPSQYLRPETHEECLKDVSNGKALSVACMKAVREMGIFNNLRAHVVWDQELPYLVRTAGHKFDLALKHAFFSHMTAYKKTFTKGIHFESTYINKLTDKPVFDFVINKPTEIVKFHRICAGLVLPFTSVDSTIDSYVQKYTNNSYPASCALMDQYVRTYDLKTMKLPREDVPSCTYILSTHCTDRKKFAVLAKIDPSVPGTQEIHVYIGKNEIVLVPGSRSHEYKVKYNDEEYPVHKYHPIMFNEKEVIFAAVHHTADRAAILELHAKKAGVKIEYNGRNVKITVHPRYKGELCGLCSEFNGEISWEMKGIDKCLYSNSADFIKSAMVGSCRVKEYDHPKICNDDEITSSWDRRQTEKDEVAEEPTLKRNMVLTKEDKICFSIKPVPVCDESPSRAEIRNIEFHCLPKEDRNARKLVIESKRRILGEIETKSVDMTLSSEVPTAC